MQDEFFYTYHRADGSRLIEGTGSFPAVRALDVALSGRPAWVVGYAANTAAWHVVLENGDLELVEMPYGGQPALIGRQAGWFAPGQPLIVGVMPYEGAYVVRGDASVSPLSHPAPLGDVDLLYVASNGDVVLAHETGPLMRQPLNALPDARPVVSSAGQVALYANPVGEREVHGGPGSSALVVLELRNNVLRIVTRVELPETAVFAGVAPLWADINGDGVDDLITTVSDGQDGARVRAYLFDGERIMGQVDGPAGERWPQPLAWGPFGPDGEPLLVDVLTPHIGGVLRFYRYSGRSFEVLAQLPGYTAHVPGPRSPDMAVGGDFDGDGHLEMALLTQDRGHVAGIQYTAEGPRAVWSLAVDGQVVTNLSAVRLPDGRLGLAAGTDEGRLRIWMP